MKHFTYLIILSASIVGCSGNKPVEVVITEPNNLSKENTTIKLSNDWIYYQYEGDGDFQTLKIRWINEDKIEFELIADNEPCRFEQKGTAVKSKNQDSEIDEDEFGKTYPSDEYFIQESGQLISIRIEIDEHSFARITYDYGEQRDECDPYSNVAMKKMEVKK